MSCGYRADITPPPRCRGKQSTRGRSRRSLGSICKRVRSPIVGEGNLRIRPSLTVGLLTQPLMARARNTTDQLEESKRRFGDNEAKALSALSKLAKSKIADAESLIRLHEALLFLRAYPPSDEF